MTRSKISKPLEPITLYLNTEINCTKIYNSDNTKILEYQFNNLNLNLSEYCVMKLISIAHDAGAHGDSIICFRVKGLSINNELYRSNDNSPYPIIFANAWKANEPAYFDQQLGGIFLNNQLINNFSFVLSDTLNDINSGVPLGLQFLIGISFIPYDRKYSDIEF